jgi:predicted ABC-type ATPase
VAIYVLAGVNGAGKSSLGGAMFRARNADYYNPDETARKILAIHHHLDLTAANAHAWEMGRALLEKAIAQNLDFAFETTLGGKTITSMLVSAAASGTEIRVWYAGLANVELHLTRVRSRVRRGGHDIPEADIRRRWNASRENLIRLLPHLAELRMFDNSREGDPARGAPPAPTLVLEMVAGKIIGPKNLDRTPEWAKPVVAAALRDCLKTPESRVENGKDRK